MLFSAPSFNEVQVSFSIRSMRRAPRYSRLCDICAGPDSRCNHGWQRRFDNWLLRCDLTAPSHRRPGHRLPVSRQGQVPATAARSCGAVQALRDAARARRGVRPIRPKRHPSCDSQRHTTPPSGQQTVKLMLSRLMTLLAATLLLQACVCTITAALRMRTVTAQPHWSRTQ
jgi:hypothetical protein